MATTTATPRSRSITISNFEWQERQLGVPHEESLGGPGDEATGGRLAHRRRRAAAASSARRERIALRRRGSHSGRPWNRNGREHGLSAERVHPHRLDEERRDRVCTSSVSPYSSS